MIKELHDKCLENTDAILGPGPNAYHIAPTIGMPKTTDPSFWQSPAFSMRGHLNHPVYVSSPGPAYRVDQTTRHGRYTNAKYDIGMVLNKKDCVQSPGPAAYLPCYPNLKRAPTPKFLLPIKDGTRYVGPSPNDYSLRNNHQSSIKSRQKGYTIKWRTKECGRGETDAVSPGPADYSPTDADVYKNRAPAATFGIMSTRPGNCTAGSTPHAYLMVFADGCVKRCRPNGFSFGKKHPRKHPPYVVPADNCPI